MPSEPQQGQAAAPCHTTAASRGSPQQQDSAKLCRRCETWKAASSFNRCSRGRNGLHAYCKTCLAEYNKERSVRLLERLGPTGSRAPAIKVCSMCKCALPREAFYFGQLFSKDGLSAQCKACPRLRPHSPACAAMQASAAQCEGCWVGPLAVQSSTWQSMALVHAFTMSFPLHFACVWLS